MTSSLSKHLFSPDDSLGLSTFLRARTCREPVLLSTGPSLDLMMVEKGSDPLWIFRQRLSDPDMGKGVARRLIASGFTCVCRTVLTRVWQAEGQPVQGVRRILWTIAVKCMKDWRLRSD